MSRPYAGLSHWRVGGDRAYLADLQHRRERSRIASSARSAASGVRARQQVLRLELRAAARRELGPEVRQSLVPGPGHPELLGAVHRRASPAPGASPRWPGSAHGNPSHGTSVRRLTHACTKPDRRQSVNRLTLYADADTVSKSSPASGSRRRRAGHLEVRLQVERERGDDAERAQRGHGAVETGVAPADRQRPSRRRGPARPPVRPRPASRWRSPSRACRSRPNPPPRCAAARPYWAARTRARAPRRASSAYRTPPADADRTGRRVDLDGRRERGQRGTARPAARVGDLVERVPAAEDPHAVLPATQGAQRVERVRPLQLLGGVGDVPRPVGHTHARSPPGSPFRQCAGGHGPMRSYGRAPTGVSPAPTCPRRPPRACRSLPARRPPATCPPTPMRRPARACRSGRCAA